MKTKNNRKKGWLVVLSLALTCMMAVSVATPNSIGGQPITAYAELAMSAYEPTEDPSPAIYVAEKNANSVVGVITNMETWDASRREIVTVAVAQGSGVVIAEDGYVLTNYHVIEGGTAYQVLMPSGEKVDAYSVGGDSSLDLAVLKVEDDYVDQLTPVTLGTTESLKVGSTVVAIGNPGGEVLANSVTQGIVSALERTSVKAQGATRRISYIQHDAAINSGNSGGGLFNYKGELVGINTLKYSGSAYSSISFEGLGFAIPVETVVDVAQDLMQYGKVIRPALGVNGANQEGPDKPLTSAAPASVCIHGLIQGGAAEKAGLKQFDFIYEIEGNRITSMLDLTGVLDLYQPGDTVSVTVIRYNQAGYYTAPSISSIFGYGYGYGYGNNGASSTSTEVVVGGGFQEITVQVTLEELE